MAATLKTVQRIAEADPTDFPQMDDSFQSLIDMGNSLVDEVCAGNSLITGVPHTAGRMEQLRNLMAAHFCKILDPQLVREEVSTLRAVYQQEVKIGLSQTRYGDQAKVLDTTGGLAMWDKMVTKGGASAKTAIGWLGRDF